MPVHLKSLTKVIFAVIPFTAVLLAASCANCQEKSWTGPQNMAGSAYAFGSFSIVETGTFVDKTGQLFLGSTDVNGTGVNQNRPLFQKVGNPNVIGPAEYLPVVPNIIVSQEGDATTPVQDPDGNRIVMWTVGRGIGAFMQWQSLAGTLGPNIVSIGSIPTALAFRNGRIMALYASPSDILIREWTVGSDGMITAGAAGSGFYYDPASVSLGGAIAIDADGSAAAIFAADRQVRTASRTSGGMWTLDPGVIDSVDGTTQFMIGVLGKSTPGGRIIAIWGAVGRSDVFTDKQRKDLGGAIRAIVREPDQPFPSTFRTLESAAPDLNSGAARRDFAIDVASGLDGTVAALSYTAVCGNAGTLRTSRGLLWLAGPNEKFTDSQPIEVPPLASSADSLPITDPPRLTGAFAVENSRAVIAIQTVTAQAIGTDTYSTCGSSGPGPVEESRPAYACIYDGRTKSMKTTLIGELAFVEAAMDAEGNAAIICAGALVPPTRSCVYFFGEWGPVPDAPVISSLVFHKGPPTRVTLSWPTVQGRLYAVQRSTNLKDWNEVTADLLGNGGLRNFTDQGVEQGATQYFYRIRKK